MLLLDELQTYKDLLLQVITQLRGIVKANIRRLPTEVLLVIFLDYYDLATEDIEDCKWRPHPALTLGRVCSKWRTVAYGSPTLSSKIDSDVLNHSSPDPAEIHRVTNFCLEKFSTAPLQISFGLIVSNLKMPFSELTKHSHRWRTLELSQHSPGFKFPAHLPILYSLSPSLKNDAVQSAKMINPAFKVYSPMRKLELARNTVTVGSRFDTSSLTTLVVDCSSLLGIMKQSTSLYSLHLNDITLNNLPMTSSIPFLVSLSSLSMELDFTRLLHSPKQDLVAFFSNYTAPWLRNLSIRSRRHCSMTIDHARTVPVLHEHLTRSGPPPLTSLALREFEFENLRDLFDILSILSPTLARLSLVNCNAFPRDHGLWDEFLQRRVRCQFIPR
ncbi:hypothetical protein L218DRAFT_1074836 [Marasmius fiardii PR-910]|nr:hypothetical protein L218DRAFT_1074836 [Marasmius fiardii PR-910]